MEEKTVTKVNGIDMETLNSTIDAIKEQPELGKCIFRARNKWMGATHNCTTFTCFYGAKHELSHKHKFEIHADEPSLLAGGDENANPVEHLLNALASCLTTSMVAHAAVRGIHIEELESIVEGDLDMQGFLGLSYDVPMGYKEIRIRFKVKCEDSDVDKLKKLAEYSPVYNTLLSGVKVDLQVEKK